MSKLLSRMHITDMQLDKRDIHADQSVSDAHRSVGQSTWVDDDPVNVLLAVAVGAEAGGFVDAVDDLAFVIGLVGCECEVELFGVRCGVGFDVAEGCVAVDLGFAGAEEVQVWPVD